MSKLKPSFPAKRSAIKPVNKAIKQPFSAENVSKKSPLAPKRFPKIPKIPGLSLAAGASGIKSSGKKDLLFVEFSRGTSVAGALTRSKTRSAPVDWCEKVLKLGKARGLLANSGNSNAFTGVQGELDVQRQAATAAKLIGTKSNQILVASTGVIGERLPLGKVESGLGKIYKNSNTTSWLKAAESICTTDTYPKGAFRVTEIAGKSLSIAGIAKGSGMIAPDLGTMFAFIFTDASIPSQVLQKLLNEGVKKSFNAITVDSDTSTSDTVLLFATGKGGRHPKIEKTNDPNLKSFRSALNDLLRDLACQIVRDGEGATKFVTINVQGARSNSAARKIGLSIANSPLVKTAISGEDPNWGRIVMAIGKSGEEAVRDSLSISFGPHSVAVLGELDQRYDESKVAKYMLGKNIEITVDVGVSLGKFTVWTCDLSHEYISINADYRS